MVRLKGVLRKTQLTTKQAAKGYYKGTRTGSMGDHTKWGGYKLDFKKVRTYVVPSTLQGFKLTPFVTNRIKPEKGKFGEYGKGMTPRSGEYYLRLWEDAGSNV